MKVSNIRKDDLLKFLKIFEDVNEKIEKNKNIELDVFVKCQEQALDLGNYIVYAYKDNNTDSIAQALEDYCDYIYQISQTEDNNSRLKISKKIRKLIISIQNDIKNKLPKDKKEIVFLPYMAAMWGSLESIYLEAKKDENCNVYVVPIPYYYKNNDGSMGELHYEGDKFPKDIPITLFQDYSIEENKPDVVYIHNPYDNWNRVTSVHPAFYASELKKNVKELIYVPYFVLNEIEPDNEIEVNKIKHFITTPGVIYADKVIVQSKKMKQIYVNEYIKWAKEQKLQGKHVDRGYQESRIFGAGSPKIEKLLRTKFENLNIPKDWLKIIRKSDGNWKKIILYNNSIVGLLEHREKMLEKMEEILKIFKENRDEVVLLWRPHPLIEQTIISMVPNLWHKYKMMRDIYITEGWGIYDDTADVERAIIISDAYYGDQSSLVQMYESTGKPIMIVNAVNAFEANNKRLRFRDYYDDGENIWFCAVGTNGLFKFDKVIREAVLMGKIPLSSIAEAYRAIHRKENKIYIAPIFQNELIVYNIEKNKFKKYDISIYDESNRGLFANNVAKFRKIYEYEKYLFFVPMHIDMILRFNTETEEINCYNEFANMLIPGIIKKEDLIFGISCLNDNKIYLPCLKTDAIVEFDMKSCESKIYFPKKSESGYHAICRSENKFWLLNKDGIYDWKLDGETSNFVKIDLKGRFHDILNINNEIIHIPLKGELMADKISAEDITRLSCMKFNVLEDKEFDTSYIYPENSAALCIKVINDKIHIFSTVNDSLGIYNIDGELLDRYIFEVREKDYNEYLNMQYRRYQHIKTLLDKNAIIAEDFVDMKLQFYIQGLNDKCMSSYYYNNSDLTNIKGEK